MHRTNSLSRSKQPIFVLATAEADGSCSHHLLVRDGNSPWSAAGVVSSGFDCSTNTPRTRHLFEGFVEESRSLSSLFQLLGLESPDPDFRKPSWTAGSRLDFRIGLISKHVCFHLHKGSTRDWFRSRLRQ